MKRTLMILTMIGLLMGACKQDEDNGTVSSVDSLILTSSRTSTMTKWDFTVGNTAYAHLVITDPDLDAKKAYITQQSASRTIPMDVSLVGQKSSTDVFIRKSGLISRPLGRKTGGVGDLFPHKRKDFKEKSSIPRSLLRGFFIMPLTIAYAGDWTISLYVVDAKDNRSSTYTVAQPVHVTP
jgi:hypothetical protein